MKAKKQIARRRRRTPEEAKFEITQVAREFLSKHPFRELTVGKLMERTKIGRSAFYAYFTDVYDLAEIFIHELSSNIETGGADWVKGGGDTRGQIRESLDNAISVWEAHGPMILSLEQAAASDKRLEGIWRDKIALGPIRQVAAIIGRDQAAGLIPPMDPLETSIALNRFNMTYLNDRFGRGRNPRERSLVLDTLERIWFGTLYGEVPAEARKRKRRKSA